MEQNQEVPVGVQSKASGSTEKKEDVVKYETYKKVLAEKKARDERLSAMEARLKEYEQRDLESKGKHEEVISSLRDQVRNLQGEVAKRDKAYVMSKVEGAIKTKALAAGCLNPDKLLRLLDGDKINSLEVNDRYEVSEQDVDFLVSEAKKENEFLFKKSRANVVDGDPVGQPKIALAKPVEKMTNEELEAEIKRLHAKGL